MQDDTSVDAEYKIRENGGQINNKPIMPLKERKIMLDAIKYIDGVFIYTTEENLYDKLKNLDYDVRILGKNWEGKKYTGRDLSHTPYFNKRDHSFSTTELRNRVYEQEKLKKELLQRENNG